MLQVSHPAATRRETLRGVGPVSRRAGGGGAVPASAVGCGSPGRGTRHPPARAGRRSVEEMPRSFRPEADPVLGGAAVYGALH